MSRVLRNLLGGATVAAGLLALLEGALRLGGWPDPGLYEGDPAGLWTLRPDLAPRAVPFKERGTTFTVRTNARGWRGGAPMSGAVLCLGDSTTFGWGVEEEEAWPSRLGVRLGRDVINGGVPGYSTHQGLATLEPALAVHPAVVVLAYLVRDAELAPVEDAARPPSRPAPALQLLRAVRALRPAPPPPPAVTPRVPPATYAENLRTMVARIHAAGARAVLLAFPMRDPPQAHLAALHGLAEVAPVLEPHLPDDAFFAEDPIHLTAAGNAALADAVAEALAPPAASPAAPSATPAASPVSPAAPTAQDRR